MGIVHKIRERLRARALNRFIARVGDDNAKFDRVYRTDTATNLPLQDYDVSEENKSGAVHYEAVHEGVLRTIIEALAPAPQEVEFIDIGCGKGKALMLASAYPFKRVRGVELSQKLVDIANQNISTFATAGPMRAIDVKAQCQDARQVSDFGNRTLVFLFNPFHEEIMEAFVPHLEAEASAPGRSMIIAYLTPYARGGFDRARSFTKLFDAQRLAVYATPGESISAEARAKLERRFTSYAL